VKVIGLTGGIGSGKSTVSAILAELGALVIDADRIGHEAYAPGTEGWRQVVEEFGTDIVAPDGSIDRGRLGAIVFADRSKLERLSRIVHPLIRDEIRRRIAAQRAAGRQAPVVVEAALLIEAGWNSVVDEVWVVVADRQTATKRVAAQRGLDTAAIESRMSAQLADDVRRRHAHVVIDNSGTEAALRARIEELWRERFSG
jgi:dephospho-CoA kinase